MTAYVIRRGAGEAVDGMSTSTTLNVHTNAPYLWEHKASSNKSWVIEMLGSIKLTSTNVSAMCKLRSPAALRQLLFIKRSHT